VIELAVGPEGRVVAQLTCRREADGNVIDGNLRIVVVRLVAADARRVSQLVVVVHVAIGALPRRNHMGTRQGEAGLRVIEVGT